MSKDGREVKKRKCLKCFQMFISLWNGNRICHKCKQSIEWKNSQILRDETYLPEKD